MARESGAELKGKRQGVRVGAVPFARCSGDTGNRLRDDLDPNRKAFRTPGRGFAITRKELAAHGWSLHDCAGLRLTGVS